MRKFISVKITLLILVLTMSLSVIAQGATGQIGNYVKFRTGPSTDAAVISNLEPNTSVAIEARNGDSTWLLVRLPDGQRGWVFWSYVGFDTGSVAELPVSGEVVGGAPPPANAQPVNQPAPVASGNSGQTIDNLNVRGAPEGTRLATIGARVPVVIEARNNVGDWILVHSADGSLRGWVASRYVIFNDVSLNDLPVSGEQVNSASSPAPAQPVQAPPANPGTDVGEGVVISTVNVRIGPSTANQDFASLPSRTNVAIEAQSSDGGWLLVRTRDGGLRGWVAANLINVTQGDRPAFPVSSEIVPAGEQGLDVLSIELPEGDYGQQLQRLQNTPIFHNFNSSRIYEIFRAGLAQGNQRNVFMKVGDSRMDPNGQPFLIGFGNGNYNLGPYGYLQDTVNFFAGPPAADSPNSFVRRSISAQAGFTAGAVFDGLWVNPAECSVAPLYCEYDKTKASVALVAFGPQDMQISDKFTFQANMYRMVDDLVARGVIPVLMTFGNYNGFRMEDAVLFNNIILNAAQDYNVPVINLWAASQPLPDNGIKTNDPVHMTHADTFFSFANGEETVYGLPLMNLLALQGLNELRNNVLLR